MVPAVPVNVDTGLDGVVIAPPAPFMILQLPVPVVGAFAARVRDVNPQVAAPV